MILEGLKELCLHRLNKDEIQGGGLEMTSALGCKKEICSAPLSRDKN